MKRWGMFHVKRSREGEMFHVKQKRVAFRCPAGACLLCRLLTLPLVCFFAPIPPTPFPRGEGGDFCFLMQGAPPLASPGLNPGGTGSIGGAGAPGTPAAKPGRHWLFLPYQCFPAPIPPAPPFPAGRGRFCFILPGAGAPGTPAAKPGRHWLFSAMSVLFCPPSPTLFPAGRGRFLF